MAEFTDRLAEFVVAARPGAAALEMMRLSLFDWAACGIAGRDEPVARITREMIADEGGAAQAHVFGGGAYPVRAAALVNGAASHALDYDDTHFAHIGHPSVAVIPAALALGEQRQVSGAAFLEACLIGVETSVRVGVWLGRAHYQAGFHQTATAGAFGAAAAAARVLGLSADRVADALGLVATRAAGLKAQFGTMGKPYNAGIAAASGVEAALLVARGFQPERGALDGPLGFGDTHHGVADISALEGLGQIWQFEQISHKFHACCHGLHAVLEAAMDLSDVAAEDIAEIDVVTHPRWMTVCNQLAPMTGLGAKFSYGTVLAMRFLGYDTARLDSFDDAVCQDPAVRALRQRVRVTADEALSETQAQLTLVLRDGSSRGAAHDLNRPMPLDVRRAKLRAKGEALLGEAQADRLWSLIEGDAEPGALGAAICR